MIKYIYFLNFINIAIFCINCQNKNNFHHISDFVINEKKNRTVLIYRDQNLPPLGSGCIIKDGYVLTAQHVLTDAWDKLWISYDGNTLTSVNIVKSEAKFDLALLKIIESNQEFPKDNLSFIDREKLNVGDYAFAWTGAYGAPPGFYLGMISHKNRLNFDPMFPKIPFIQVNGIAYPGASGSCVFDEKGNWIGIVRAAIGIREASQVGLVIPIGFVNILLLQYFK